MTWWCSTIFPADRQTTSRIFRAIRDSNPSSDPLPIQPWLAHLVGRADAIIHLAAAVGVRLILEKPVHTIENNLFGTAVILAAAAMPIVMGNPESSDRFDFEVYGKGTSRRSRRATTSLSDRP
jgi:hypothetical protein